MTYNWIFYPILAAFLWATVNHLDKYLIDKYCKNQEVGGLIIFSSLIGVPTALIIFLLNPSVLNIDLLTSIIIIVAGSLYLLGIIPYLYALDIDETSVVAPQALMLTIFTGILGYIFLGENITFIQLLGIIIILLGAITLSLDIKDITRMKMKTKVFGLMLISSFFIGLHIFLFKYFAIDISFLKTIFWIHIGFIVISIVFLLFIKRYKDQFFNLIRTNPLKIIFINTLGETLTIIGNLASYYGAFLVPLVISETIAEGTQPFFVLLIGIIITILFPKFAQEDLSLKIISHKLVSISLMLLGLVLLT